ncbi:MAG: hypothetical protein ACJ790_12915 [Myxococcaceae bacterium]
MSETNPQQPQAQEAPPPAADANATACPINADFLPPNLKKHVDTKAPVPLRMMAAKSLVPLSPPQMLSTLYMLTFDPDQAVRDQAAKTAATLPDRIAGTAFREESVHPPVLAWFLELFGSKDTYAELLILNATTPDEAVARLAKTATAKTAETIGQNQLRILRHDDIIRQLCANPNASPALLDSVCDFAVRSGLVLQDVPQMQAARVRLFGAEVAQKPPDPGPTAEEVLKEFGEAASSETAPPMEEGKRMTLTQKILKMSISQKIKLATLGNKEARGQLLRDSNKLVAVAAIRSPRITDGEILSIANNRAAHDDVLRVIYGNREYTKQYPIKLALVKNPKVPLAITMKFLGTLHDSEVKDLARNKNVPSGIQQMAKKLVEKKTAPKKEEK